MGMPKVMLLAISYKILQRSACVLMWSFKSSVPRKGNPNREGKESAELCSSFIYGLHRQLIPQMARCSISGSQQVQYQSFKNNKFQQSSITNAPWELMITMAL